MPAFIEEMFARGAVRHPVQIMYDDAFTRRHTDQRLRVLGGKILNASAQARLELQRLPKNHTRKFPNSLAPMRKRSKALEYVTRGKRNGAACTASAWR